MKRLKAVILGGILGAALLGGMAGAQAAGLIPDFEKEFLNEVETNKVPGAAYAIIKGGRVVAVKVYGTRAVDADLPVTSQTVFRLASVSKTFAADLAAILAKEGKLDLETPVTKFVPALEFKSNGFANKVKLKHLLSHSAGITPNAYDNMLEDGWALDKIVPRFDRIEPMCQPGDCYGYQNILFSLIEPAIEQATGKSYPSLVESRLLKPLGMQHASLGLEAYLSTANRAEPHIFTRRNGWIRVMVDRNYYRVAPAAGVNASIEDLAKWVVAQMGYNDAVLPTPVLEMVTEKRVDTSRELRRRGWRGKLTDAHYGFGWRIYAVDGHDVVLHAGGVKGFRTFVSYSKDLDLGFAIMANAQTSAVERLSSRFWVAALDEFETSTSR
ncbi:serine hydrolase domain-containing protein [Kordiimonas lacus]|uniref:Beta-lactamase class C n=1 Tax=Kordiimonas lacus TaxID=637679 RepID=A0A1G7DFZ9_9PROT|nr:serine hydrolase domain-containing protein [Kordiimonas lacus]SDE50462.1 beta-lactamase class C [Kordiimonas lacus]